MGTSEYSDTIAQTDLVDEGLNELRASLLHGFSLVCMVASWFWLAIAAITYERVLGPAILLAPLLLFFCSLIAVVVNDPTGDRQLLRRWVFLIGIALALAPIFPWREGTAQWYLGSLAITAAGAVLGPPVAGALAFIYGFLLIYPISALTPQELSARGPAIVILFGTAIATWLASRSLYTALIWAMNSQRQAWEAAREARSRREELRRTVFSLKGTHERLERTVQELATARRQAEDAHRLRSEFAANISHELRTPLNIILGFSEIMTRSPEVYGSMTWPRMLLRDLFEIRRNALYLSGFVDDILDLARLDALRMPMHREPSDLGVIVGEAVAIVAHLVHDTPVEICAELPDDLPELYIDQTRIRQVMVNLLSNACRFTEQGEITITARQDAASVQISINDTGLGISPERLEVIFDQYEQAGAWRRSELGGKGLGLAIARQLVELHGGTIWAESRLGSGSTFHFTLPVSLVHVGQLTRIGPREAGTNGDTSTIVLLGADETVARYLDRRLDMIQVVAAADETEARALVAELRPIAVLANAEADECVECAARSVDLGRPIPVIGCNLPSQAYTYDEERFAGCLIKPVSSDALVEAVLREGSDGEILIVDDDRAFVQFVERSLQSARVPFRIKHAYSGSEALEQLQKIVPTVILMDMIMPDMNAIQIADVMNGDARVRDVPVILVTGANLSEQTLPNDRASFCLVRPGHVSGDELVRLIEMSVDNIKPSYSSDGDAEPSLATDRAG